MFVKMTMRTLGPILLNTKDINFFRADTNGGGGDKGNTRVSLKVMGADVEDVILGVSYDEIVDILEHTQLGGTSELPADGAAGTKLLA